MRRDVDAAGREQVSDVVELDVLAPFHTPVDHGADEHAGAPRLGEVRDPGRGLGHREPARADHDGQVAPVGGGARGRELIDVPDDDLGPRRNASAVSFASRGGARQRSASEPRKVVSDSLSPVPRRRLQRRRTGKHGQPHARVRGVDAAPANDGAHSAPTGRRGRARRRAETAGACSWPWCAGPSCYIPLHALHGAGNSCDGLCRPPPAAAPIASGKLTRTSTERRRGTRRRAPPSAADRPRRRSPARARRAAGGRAPGGSPGAWSRSRSACPWSG